MGSLLQAPGKPLDAQQGQAARKFLLLNRDFGNFTGLDPFFTGLFLAGRDRSLAENFSLLALPVVNDSLNLLILLRNF